MKPGPLVRKSFPLVLAALVLGPQIYCITARVDRWPFSNYSMFSYREKIASVKIVRLQLEDSSGNRRWWTPRNNYFYTKDFNSGYLRSRALQSSDPEDHSQAVQNFLKYFALRIIDLDPPDFQIKRFNIIERSVRYEDGIYKPIDYVLFSTAVEDLK